MLRNKKSGLYITRIHVKMQTQTIKNKAKQQLKRSETMNYSIDTMFGITLHCGHHKTFDIEIT